jgi:hypothetical protein
MTRRPSACPRPGTTHRNQNRKPRINTQIPKPHGIGSGMRGPGLRWPLAVVPRGTAGRPSDLSRVRSPPRLGSRASSQVAMPAVLSGSTRDSPRPATSPDMRGTHGQHLPILSLVGDPDDRRADHLGLDAGILPGDCPHVSGDGPGPWPGSLPGLWFLARVLPEARCHGWAAGHFRRKREAPLILRGSTAQQGPFPDLSAARAR